MGIHVLDDNMLNHKYALPNKFFDFIVAGLVVAISPTAEMAKIVRKYNIGIVFKSFLPEDMAEEINSLTLSDMENMREASVNASDYLNANIEMQKLAEVYHSLLRDKSKV